jgi:hypothetical protein
MGVLLGLVSYVAAVATTPVRGTVASAKLLKSDVSLTSQRRTKELTAQRSASRSARKKKRRSLTR